MTTPYEEYGIDCTWGKSKVQAVDTVPSVRNEVQAYEEHGEQGEKTDEEMDAHLQCLLQAAVKRVIP